MGLLTTIHAVENADSVAIAKNLTVIQSGPHEDCGGLNPVHIQRLHQILTGEDEATVSSYYANPVHIESEEGPWVLAIPPIFVSKLISTPASLAPVVLQWVATPEMQADRWQPPAALLLLSKMRNFLRDAQDQNKVSLLIISL